MASLSVDSPGIVGVPMYRGGPFCAHHFWESARPLDFKPPNTIQYNTIQYSTYNTVKKKNGHACAMRNSKTGKYDTLLTWMAVYFCKNRHYVLASAVFLCSLYCLTLWCIVYFLHSAVFFFDCSLLRFEKKSEQRRTPARPLAGVTVTQILYWLTYVAFLSAACMLMFGNLVENYGF